MEKTGGVVILEGSDFYCRHHREVGSNPRARDNCTPGHFEARGWERPGTKAGTIRGKSLGNEIVSQNEMAEGAGIFPKWTELVRVCSRIEILGVRGEAILSHCSLCALVPRLSVHDPARSWAPVYDPPRTCDDESWSLFLSISPARISLVSSASFRTHIQYLTRQFLWCVAVSEEAGATVF